MTTTKDYVKEAGIYAEQRLREVRDEMSVLQKLAERSADKRLTADERRQWDELEEESRQLTRHVDYMSSQRVTTPDPLSVPYYARGGNAATGGSGPRFIDRDGREIRTYKANEKICGKQPDIDVGRLIRGMVSGDWTGAEYERRMHQGNVSTTGGIILGGDVSAYVSDLARNKMQVMKAGPLTLPMPQREMTVVRQTSDVTASWRPEGGRITESDSAWGAVNLTAKNLGAVTSVSRELMMDAPNFGSLVENSLAQAAALAWDAAALTGVHVGGGSPGGIINDSEVSVNNVAAGGSAITADNLSSMVQAVRSSNYEPNAMLLPVTVAGQLDRMKSGDGRYLAKTDFPPSVAALDWLPTGQLTNQVIVGQFDQLLVAMLQQVEIMAFGAGSLTAGRDAVDYNLVHLRMTMRGDIAVLRGSAFRTYTGVLTS